MLSPNFEVRKVHLVHLAGVNALPDHNFGVFKRAEAVSLAELPFIFALLGARCASMASEILLIDLGVHHGGRGRMTLTHALHSVQKLLILVNLALNMAVLLFCLLGRVVIAHQN